jgi:multidrug efflux pump
MPLLPLLVQQQGVNVTKGNSSFLMVVGLVSDDNSMDRTDIADYVSAHMVEPLSRVPGVGNVQVFGSEYAMRIWLDPDKLNTYRLAPSDIISAIEAQNAQVSVGQLGALPAVPGQELNATVTAQGRLQTPEQFAAIILRSRVDGSTLRLSDVARVEIGSSNYNSASRYNTRSAAGIAIMLATNANALATADAVRAVVAKMEPNFPHGLRSVVPFDTTPFVRVSIHDVVKTLAEAIVLVFLVMFLFLQNFRATLIPTIAVPVVLLGTFGVLAAAGLSINMLTMFAMVLAIGLLVDDAIVVVENVERVMREDRLSPLEATRKSMDQITGALVGIAMVLSAVFLPMAFLSGSTGVIYRQFSITIVSAMALSVLVALVLTPALCATLLKPHSAEHQTQRGFVGWFNRTFDRSSEKYRSTVSKMLRRTGRSFVIYGAICAVMLLLFVQLPTSFLPDEDQGVMFVQVQAPMGATQARTSAVMEQVEHYFLTEEKDAVESIFAVLGFSFGGGGQNNAMAFVKLRDWDQRTDRNLGVQAVANRAMGAFSQIRDAMVYAFPPPPLPELGRSQGFSFFLQDVNGSGHDALIAARNQLLGAARQSKLLTNVRPNGQDDTPQFRLDIDAARAGSLGVSIADIIRTLSVEWGGQYIDDFIDRGRVKRVYLQADAPFRMKPEDFNRWYVRNSAGEMVPFSAFASSHWEFGSPRLERFNGVSAVEINGAPAEGVSSGDAMQEIEKLVEQLPPGFDIAWSGASYQERTAGSQTPLLYSLSILVVFLCLAALYESWAIPAAVMLVVPLGIVGAVVATGLRGLERDVYFQVAMLTTIGLASKNAVLIVEFAKHNLEAGMNLAESVMHAIRDRLRPIVMTSMAFGLGVLPLAIANGAGSGAQRAIGTGVVGGMLTGTFLGIFFVPLFFVVVLRLVLKERRHHEHHEDGNVDQGSASV